MGIGFRIHDFIQNGVFVIERTFFMVVVRALTVGGYFVYPKNF